MSVDYNLYLRFIEAYLPQMFKNIDNHSPDIDELEVMLAKNNQFFYVGDLLKLQILYTSRQSENLLGILPKELSIYHFFKCTHPEDFQRLSAGRSKLLILANNLYAVESGNTLLSTVFRMADTSGNYHPYLIQCYLFYVSSPIKTVLILKIHTKLDGYKLGKKNFHYYLGQELDNFRFPDEKLLNINSKHTTRELDILRQIDCGLSSEQIADKLYLSVHTINTHRRNILKKAGKANISELIFELKEQGLI